MDQLPKYHETFFPILQVLGDGQPMHYHDMQKKVLDLYYKNLPSSLLEQRTNTWENTLFNRISWAKSYLKQGKFVTYPARWMVQITDKWKNNCLYDLLLLKISKKMMIIWILNDEIIVMYCWVINPWSNLINHHKILWKQGIYRLSKESNKNFWTNLKPLSILFWKNYSSSA